MTTPGKKRLVSVRLKRPTRNEDLEVRFETEECDEVDAVFTSVDVVEKILVPFYEARQAGSGRELLREVREQQEGGICMVLHKLSCNRMVPPIDWTAKSPIVL